MTDPRVSEAFEVLEGSTDAPVVVTCEHATQRMPEGWSWPEADRRLVDTHWAYDLGALDVAEELASSLDATVASSRFTRLLVDPNRPDDASSLFREVADGKPIHLNCEGLDAQERERRLNLLYRPYHAAVDAAVARSRAPTLVAIHSFTRFYEGSWRELEIGVLFDRDERLGESVAEALAQRGLGVALNEPYSGRGGLMYSVDRHATAHGRLAVELEIRQDLATYRGFRRALGPILREIFSAV